METIGTPVMWVGFLGFVLAMLGLDLGVFHRKSHEVSFREALGWSGVWVALAGVFAALTWWAFGAEIGMQFAAGYLIEKALAVDNIFVFVMIFGAFGVPSLYQHRVLFWGVLGALAARAVFIGLGAAVIAQFHWVMYVFGAILVFTAAKLMLTKEGEADPRDNAVYRLFHRWVPSTDTWRGPAFVVSEGGRWLATPLLAVLVLVEASDILFAIDSIPAIFAVTRDPFVVFTSNIFAILGLRSMYFLLADVVHRFVYLKPALSAILGFVGVKMLISGWVHVPVAASLAVILGVLAVAILASVAVGRRPEVAPERVR